MEREIIIRMAREAGGTDKTSLGVVQFFVHELERFAALVAAAEREAFAAQTVQLVRDAVAEAKANEREACAKVCDERANLDGFEGSYADKCAAAIRARGKNEMPGM